MRGTLEVELDGRALAFLSRVSGGRDELGDAVQSRLERTPGRTFALLPSQTHLAAANLYHFRSARPMPADTGRPDARVPHVLHSNQHRTDVLRTWLGDRIKSDPASALLMHDHVGSNILHDAILSQAAPEWVRVVRADAHAHPSLVLSASGFEERYRDVYDLMDFFHMLGAVVGGWGELSGTVAAADLAAHFRTSPLLAVYSVAYDGDGFVCWEAR